LSRDTLLPEVMQELEEIAKGERTIGIHTGFVDYDKYTGGLQRGELVVIAGRPGEGKTSLMNCFAQNLIDKGRSVGFSSAETGAKEFTLRTLCSTAQVDGLKVRAGQFTGNDPDWDALTRGMGKLTGVGYYIDDTPEVEINTLCARATQLYRDHQIDVLLVDYLQILQVKQHLRAGDAHMERKKLDYCVTQLKTLARTLYIPVILASQFTREKDKRGGTSWQQKRPKLADLKGSGGIEQIADVVVGLFRPELYVGEKQKDKDKYKNVAELHILKQRNGPSSVYWHLLFQPQYTKFVDMETNYAEMPY